MKKKQNIEKEENGEIIIVIPFKMAQNANGEKRWKYSVNKSCWYGGFKSRDKVIENIFKDAKNFIIYKDLKPYEIKILLGYKLFQIPTNELEEFVKKFLVSSEYDLIEGGLQNEARDILDKINKNRILPQNLV